MNRFFCDAWRALLLVACPLTVQAGPPFVTDDPEPVPQGHWEVNHAFTGTHALGETTAFLPQLDINYGAAAGVQLHVMPQAGYSATPGGQAYGAGNTEVGAKIRLTPATASEEDWMVSVYPLHELSSGNAERMLGPGAGSTYLPLWVQTTRGRWTLYGGGGYWINPGAGRSNAWASGWVLLYRVNDRLQLGGEVFGERSPAPGERGFSGFNLGGSYGLGPSCSLLFSAGQGLSNVAQSNQGSFYLALQKTY
ncbi:MAG: hypothetical protein KGI47_08735 [Betaproteobacteria bacterium]|nr:hypothetical protein [Betaproteobacteria bacterium]MDE2622533.1 hypothetical protein [Betaproteobacteria bacterium]